MLSWKRALWLIGLRVAFAEDDACPSIPTVNQLLGHYAGFAIFHSLNNTKRATNFTRDKIGSLQDTSTTWIEGIFSGIQANDAVGSVWTARCNILKSNNLFWQAYLAKLEMRNKHESVIEIVIRGIRPSNSRVALLRGSSLQLQLDFEREGVVKRLFKGALRFLFGNEDEAEDHEESTYIFGQDIQGNGMDDINTDTGVPDDSMEKALLPDLRKCQVSGTLERFNYDLDDSENGAPLESTSKTFQRSPDLILRLILGRGCKGAGRMISFSFRKFEISYFRDQQTNVGILVGLKTLAEMFLLGRQFKKVEAQRALLKTCWVTIAWSILFDLFEAGFFFGRQSLGNDISLLSSLALVGLLKIVLVAAVEMKWLIVLQHARSTHRLQVQGDHNPSAWVKEMNKFVRWFAIFVILSLFAASRIFEMFPEFVISLLCLFFIPQIIFNIWSGTRHPFQTSFILGIVTCRFVLPYLVWSKTGEDFRPGARGHLTAATNLWPSWFVTPRIPPMFMDSIFGTLPRRPNSVMLSIIMSLLAAQGLYMWLQNAWSPRAGLPPWFCDKYLPFVFDYELDVTRVAGLKQRTDPNATMVDCVICMTPVKFADRQCVVTPCEHFFHKECLIKWMDVKLECPTCRRTYSSLIVLSLSFH